MNCRLLFPSLGSWVVPVGLAALLAGPAVAGSEVVALGPEIAIRKLEKPLRKDFNIPFDVATHGDGSFAIAWGEGFFDVPRVRMRRFDGDGRAERSFVIDGAEANMSQVEVLSDLQGGQVVVWSRGAYDVAARFVPSPAEGGAPGPRLTLVRDLAAAPTVARASESELVLGGKVRDTTGRYFAVRFNQAGPIEGSEVVFGLSGFGEPVLAAGPGGDLHLVTVRHTTVEEEGKFPRGDTDVVAERIPAGSAGPGRRFAVSTVSRTLDEYQPRAATLRGGGLVVVWTRGEADASIFMRRFDARGLPLTPNLRVAAGMNPDVATDRLGRTIVVWNDGENGDIRGRIFGAAGRPVGEPFRVSEVSSGSPRLSLADNGAFFVVAWMRWVPVGELLVVRRFAVS